MVKKQWMWVGLIFVLIFTSTTSSAQAKETAYMTGFTEWKAGGFTEWERRGTAIGSGGEIVMDYATAVDETDPFAAGAYYGGNFYNGGSYKVGEVASPVQSADINFSEMIVSWNATTPAGSWVEVLARVNFGSHWTKWYNLGVWASESDTIERHSVKLQGDSDGYVAVDTLVLADKKAIVEGYQIKVRLFSTDANAIPSLGYVSAAYSTSAPKKITPSQGNSTSWGTLLPVPECSQMVYPDGGNVWCSPTSVSMVLGFLENYEGLCEPWVRATVEGVYDRIYDGHGNWVFNTAYAATHGFTASVRRFANLNEVETWVKAGVPVVFSFAWGKGDLTGAAIDSSNGHLAVIVGFDEAGNPIVNDPAAATDAEVQRTYNRAELENVWLTNSGGTVYIIQRGSN